MLAELSKSPPAGEGWVFERKLDGLRCLAVRNGSDVQLWSRNRLPFTQRFPDLIQAFLSLPAGSFVIDGEIVAYENGQTSFALLQRPKPGTTATFGAFDLLELLGKSTTGIPLLERKALLAQVLGGHPRLELVEHRVGEPEELVAQACREGWEGLIAKRADGTYRSGRSKDWLKLKCSASQELVIGGWTAPKGSRVGFGALLMGYYEGDRFRYAGKVGTGFDAKLLRSLHARLIELEQDSSPFADAVKERDCHWARPELVANVSFTEWTADGKLRHPVFQGLRSDKAASEVVRETKST